MEKSKEVSQLQSQLLEMMIAFRDFVSERGLDMFLVGGSALGACRHNGFIPWDDDADLAMMRGDFEKMEKAMEQNGNRLGEYVYSPVEHHITPDAPVGYLYKLKKCGEGYEILLKIDIHPIDGVPSGKFMKKVQMVSALVYYLSTYRLPVKNKGKTIRNISKMILKMTPEFMFRFYIRMAKRIFTAWSDETSREICSLFGIAGYNREVMPREWLMPLKKVEFEGETFLAPLKTEEYLTRLYGDYRTLPPVEKRKPHHAHQRVVIRMPDGNRKEK